MALHAHPMVRDLAEKMANELFETYAQVDGYYSALKEAASKDGTMPATEKRARKLFVARVAPRLFEEARRALTAVLASEDATDYMKQQVMDALIKDNMMRANRTVARSSVKVPKGLH